MEQKKIYALGFFDGVHLGHQALLTKTQELAGQRDAVAGVITFLGHPDTLISGVTPNLINTAQDRKKLLQRYGMEHIVELPFDVALMNMTYDGFLTMLVEKYQAAGFVCGEDFRFGRYGAGDGDKLRAFCENAGLACAVVPQLTLDGITVSSTHIRMLLELGDVEQTERFLGHRHILSGTVVPGQQLGRTIGAPTANLVLPRGLLIPRFGVYICRAWVDGVSYASVTNVGIRPTICGKDVTVEAWLLDFAEDLYGREIELEMYAFLRPERKFPSVRELQKEIEKNAAQTREYFQKS